MNGARGFRCAASMIIVFLLVTGCVDGTGGNLPQPGATYSGDMAIETSGPNASAGGAGFEIKISSDGRGIISAGYALRDTLCSNDTGTVTIESGGFSAILTPSRSVEIVAGRFQFRLGNANVSGEFTSPTEVTATVSITSEESVGMGQTIICDFGTWSWTGSAH